MLSKETLISFRREISIEEAERFFDGAEADWALAQSPKVARRSKVNDISNQFVGYQSQERPLVVHLTGPGGEGKSMVLLQTLVSILEQDKARNILWHLDDATPFSLESFANIPEGPWIIATDAADMSATSIHSLLKTLNQTRRTDVMFLLCSRDSDWRASGAERLDWNKHSDFRVEMISGLSEEDANLIAASWSAFDGGNTPSSNTIHERGQALFEATKNEAAISEGAMLGGILAIRHGAGLRGHIASLMARLAKFPIESGGSLYEAFAYIAIMHAENLDFLSRPVLAKVLNCDLRELGRQVIVPLAKEAAANGGTILLTRHRRIAETAVAIIRDEYGEDISTRFVELAKAAKDAKRDYGFVPELHRWDYKLPEHFINQSPEIAVHIGRALLDLDPENKKLTVGLARIYREVSAPEEGANVLARFTGQTGREFWYEWSTCAGNTGDFSLNAVLAAFSLSDQAEQVPPDMKSVKFGLAGIGVAFGKLYTRFRDERLKNALASVAWLGLKLQVDQKAHGYFEKHMNEATLAGAANPIHLQDALSKFKDGTLAAWEVSAISQDIVERLIPPESFGFDGMEKLFSRIIQADSSA